MPKKIVYDKSVQIGAVVVTYYPDILSLGKFSSLLDFVCELVVVDNGSSPSVFTALEALSSNPRVCLICNKENIGIAAALNKGCSYLQHKGYSYALLLDQDSVVVDDMISILFATAKRNKRAAVVAPFISPASVDENAISSKLKYLVRTKSPIYKKIKPSADTMEVAMAITSGAIYDLRHWVEIGGFWDDLFIEGVDNEYCLRAHRSGYSVVVDLRATLKQQYGDQRLCTIMGKNLFPTFHSPLRHYYLSRNRIHIWKRHWRHNLFYICWDICSLLNTVFLILVAEDKKFKKIKSIIQGTIDGLKNKTGCRY